MTGVDLLLYGFYFFRPSVCVLTSCYTIHTMVSFGVLHLSHCIPCVSVNCASPSFSERPVYDDVNLELPYPSMYSLFSSRTVRVFGSICSRISLILLFHVPLSYTRRSTPDGLRSSLRPLLRVTCLTKSSPVPLGPYRTTSS